jgi:hypothetical protein
MSEDHDDRPEYDPAEPTPPERESPYRRTAPQGEFTTTQVIVGLLVMVVGLAITFGVPALLA